MAMQTVGTAPRPSSRAAIDLHREAMEMLAKPEPTVADLTAERDRCLGIVHAADMADHLSMAEAQDASRAEKRIREIDELIGRSDGSPEQKLAAIRISLEQIALHMTTRGERITGPGLRGERIAYDASFIDNQVKGLRKLIGRLS